MAILIWIQMIELVVSTAQCEKNYELAKAGLGCILHRIEES